ncbi:hypothetical protein J2X31_000039 [Flavobacterium arsenatis]|uniref:Tetracyclin repressor-like C-terminal domain-containing protein n=1 Tax=Flavobacterium arsenatis TaxID=1484332 RepID=A0ABU1TJ79_9FLAO|nr:TetR family transcriptional regulator C-terminal domain-containing protein [Flavobacterium arsenatis]MDR6966046.1 hypothetical protein [Flavobacterium arsenatis]
MATTKRPNAKKKLLDENQIITLYMDYVLEKNKAPENVYLFCKEHGIEESEFYTFFGSLDAIKQEIWVKFFENAIVTINIEEAYAGYSEKNKLLTLYFTLFEIFTLNRSYIVYSLKENKEGLKNLQALKAFRKQFKDFVGGIMNSNSEEKENRVKKITKPVFAEGAWIQFLFILKFWLDDTSKGFEKTDILIEKSVNTSADLMDTKPLESLLDLGKFIWKEKFN